MSASDLRTARALYPHRHDLQEPAFLYDPLPIPDDHPELPLFTDPAPTAGAQLKNKPAAEFSDPLPARMLNEFVYCPRLFYYEFVDGVFLENADTERGSAIHKKVDKGRGDLPPASPTPNKHPARPETGEPASPEASPPSPSPAVTETIHSRSATLGSDRLGVIAKLDLIEVQLTATPPADGVETHAAFGSTSAAAPYTVQQVTPVDYKVGAPRMGHDGAELWDADKMQLGLQMLILRDNGYACDGGIIYYRETKQRVPLAMTPTLEQWIVDNIAAARQVAASRTLPPPLVNSPKCVRCSLAPVCLPDETHLMQQWQEFSLPRTAASRFSPAFDSPHPGAGRPTAPLRRLIAARDDTRALYLNSQGARVAIRDEVLVVKEEKTLLGEFRLNDLSHLALFGNIQITTQAVQTLCEKEIPVAYFSMGGWFYGLTRGHGLKNVFTRIEQFNTAQNPRRCLALAQRFVHGKIRNHRTQIMRNHSQLPDGVGLKLKRAAGDALAARSREELLGIEGAAASLYFQHFAGMIKVAADDDDLPGLPSPQSAPEVTFNFDFTRRSRRPPTDPVNALLSLAYSLLAKDCTLAALAVGFDPYIGFYHQPRHGRPALALDLMEEFRPLIAESTVLTALNNRMITPGHFIRAGEGVNLTPQGRKVFFQVYEQRINSLITHPVFDYKASYRRVLELQARMLSRYLTGEIPEYVPMLTR